MEDNPYKAPESDLKESVVFKRSIWWKIYFFIITIISAFGMAMFFLMPGAGLAEVVSLVSWIVATVGLFGFCFLKRIYKPNIWIPFLVCYIAFGIAYYFITDVDLTMGMSESEFYLNAIIGYVLALPGYYALYMYGNADKEPWVSGS